MVKKQQPKAPVESEGGVNFDEASLLGVSDREEFDKRIKAQQQEYIQQDIELHEEAPVD